MNHAGSVVKHRAYPNDQGGKDYKQYRVGARIDPKEQGGAVLGLVFDEGHHSVEDKLDSFSFSKYRGMDQFLSGLPDLNEVFPGADTKLRGLFLDALIRSEVSPDQMLISYRTVHRDGTAFHLLDYAERYTDYEKLMVKLYTSNPKLYQLAVDCIYGDNMIAFAKEIDTTFGSGYFRRLMEAKDRQAAIKLYEELDTL